MDLESRMGKAYHDCDKKDAVSNSNEWATKFVTSGVTFLGWN